MKSDAATAADDDSTAAGCMKGAGRDGGRSWCQRRGCDMRA